MRELKEQDVNQISGGTIFGSSEGGQSIFSTIFSSISSLISGFFSRLGLGGAKT